MSPGLPIALVKGTTFPIQRCVASKFYTGFRPFLEEGKMKALSKGFVHV